MQRFKQVAELLKKRIDSGLIAVGEKLPSLRSLACETGYSVVTVYKAYELLESQGICFSKDRSGFYVAAQNRATSRRLSRDLPVMPPDNIRALDESLSRMHFHVRASAAMLPAGDLVADKSMSKIFRRSLLQQHTLHGIANEGHPKLCNAILQRAGRREIFARSDQILVTRSVMEGFNLCLDSLAQPGSPVLVESPSFYPILESLRHRGIQALEIYSHPEFGIDPDQFEHILATTGVKLCVLMGTNRFPTGVSYSRGTLERLVRAAQLHRAVIIENDMTAELSYSELRTASLKEFDNDDTVIQFSGTVSFLSTSYEVGWILAGKHTPKLIANRHLNGTYQPHFALQAAVGEYLSSRQVERDLRAASRSLALRMEHGIALLTAAGVSKAAISVPTGSFLCWVRGPRHFNSMTLAMTVDSGIIDFVPGPFFSPLGSFENFIALNFSSEWTHDRTYSLNRLISEVGWISASDAQ